jgi:hypothetical protein
MHYKIPVNQTEDREAGKETRKATEFNLWADILKLKLKR